MTLSERHRSYLIRDQMLVPAVINFLLNAGIIERAVEPTVLLQSSVDQGTDLLFRRQISGMKYRFAALALDRLQRSLPTFHGYVGDNEPCASLGQNAAGFVTDTAAGTGHDHCLSFEQSGHVQ